MFSKTDGGKHRDRHIKTMAKDAPEMSEKLKRPSPTDAHGICYFPIGVGASNCQGSWGLDEGF